MEIVVKMEEKETITARKMKKENSCTYTCTEWKGKVARRWQEKLKKAEKGGNAMRAAAAVVVVWYEKEKVAIVIALAAIDTSLKCISLVAHTSTLSTFLPPSHAILVIGFVRSSDATQCFLCADLVLLHQILAMVYEFHRLTSHTHKFI